MTEELDQNHLNPARFGLFYHFARDAFVGDDGCQLFDAAKRRERDLIPFGRVNQRNHLFGNIYNRAFERDFVGIDIGKTFLQSESARAHERAADVELLNEVGAPSADEGKCFAADDAAGHDDGDIGKGGEFLRGTQGIGNDGELAAVTHLAREFERGGAGVEENAVAVAHERGGVFANGMFRRVLNLRAIFKFEFVRGFVCRHRAAVNADEASAPFEFGQIGAHGDRRYFKRTRQLFHRHARLRLEGIFDARKTFGLGEGEGNCHRRHTPRRLRRHFRLIVFVFVCF